MSKSEGLILGALGLLTLAIALVLVVYYVNRPFTSPAPTGSPLATPGSQSALPTRFPTEAPIEPTPRPIASTTAIPEGIPTAAPSDTPAGRAEDSLSYLPITFPIMSSEVADYFNRIAQPGDIALIPTARLSMLPSINAGRVRVGFASWAQAEQELEGLIGQIDFVTYNPEHWTQTPPEEQQDLIGTVQRAAEFTHTRGIQLMVSPDRRFARESLGEIAKYADLIGLQGQRLQNDPDGFESWATELIQVARASNPEVRIFVQVGATQGTAQQMLAAIQTIEGDIDGIAIWSAPSTLSILQDFVTLLRQ
jgi:hypothetical protein